LTEDTDLANIPALTDTKLEESTNGDAEVK
jgi:hypothetical protein